MENFVGRVAGKILGGRKVALLGAVGDDAEGAQYRHDDGVVFGVVVVGSV